MPAILVSELDAKALRSRYKVVDALDSLTGWAITGAGAVQALDIINFKSGGTGYKMTVPASIAAVSTKSLGPMDLGGIGLTDQVRFWVYVDDATRVSAATIQFIDNQGSPVTATYTLTGLVNGWQRFSIAKSAFTNGATIDWSHAASLKFNVTATAGGTVNVTWDMTRLMLGPTINYSGGLWDESNGSADVVDGKVTFWDAGYWQLNDVRLLPIDFYRLDSAAVGIAVTMGTGYVRISGLNGSFALLEVINLSFDSKQALKLEQPWYYKDSTVIDALRTAQALPASTLMTAILDIFRQSYRKLSTYMLPKHEMLMVDTGDASGSGLSFDERRNLLSIRYIAAFLPMNIVGMKRLVEFFVTSASVTHNPAAYSFAIQIISPKGIPANLALLQTAIERSKPAHLGYTITYTFTVWNTMDAYNRAWNIADTYTWNNFEIS